MSLFLSKLPNILLIKLFTFSSILSVFFLSSSFPKIFSLTSFLTSSITLNIGEPSCPSFVLLPTYINTFSSSINLREVLTPIISYSSIWVLKEET